MQKHVNNYPSFLPICWQNLAWTIFYLVPFPDCGPARTDKKIKMQTCLCDIVPMGSRLPAYSNSFITDWKFHLGLGLWRIHRPQHADNYPRCLFAQPYSMHRITISSLPQMHIGYYHLASRKIRTSGQNIRKKLKIPANRKVVMLTMGGIPEQYAFLKELTNECDVHFIIPGGSQSVQIYNNLILPWLWFFSSGIWSMLLMLSLAKSATAYNSGQSICANL